MERRVTRRSNTITTTASTSVTETSSPKSTNAKGQSGGRPRRSNRVQLPSPQTNNSNINESDTNIQNEQGQNVNHGLKQGKKKEGTEINNEKSSVVETDAKIQLGQKNKDAPVADTEDMLDVNGIDKAVASRTLPTSPPATTLEEFSSTGQDTSDIEQEPEPEPEPEPVSLPQQQYVFFSEELYNRISVSSMRHLPERYLGKKREIDGTNTLKTISSSEIADKSSETPVKTKKRKISISMGDRDQLDDIITDDGNIGSSHHGGNSDTIHAVSSSAKFDINELVASVTSYVPEIASALNSVSVPKPNTDQKQQQQQSQQHNQQPPLIQMKSSDVIFQHPCIYSHDHRSTLSREEHRRYIMYEAISRGVHRNGIQAQLGSEDRALWAELQEKVDQERLKVRQWQAEVIRSRIASFFNPDIQQALDSKFKKARARVVEEYPQFYDFVQSIGLRLPSIPSTTKSAKEPTLNRKKAESIPSELLNKAPAAMSDPRGMLKRIGRVCPVSLVKPIWPTDDDGVPFEKEIDINDRYWDASAPLPCSSTGTKISEQDYRRSHPPKKSPTSSISNDPIVKQLVKEHNIQISVAASSLVALVKTLPSLTEEWEIPVKVVLEEDHEGTMQKRIYIDKPLIRKRMSVVEMTQKFYDCALKKLSLVGSSSTDANILTLSAQEARSKALDQVPKDPSDQIDSESMDKKADVTSTSNDQIGGEEEEGILGSKSAGSGESNDGFEYTLWTFGETRILIRSRIHGYLNHTEPFRQVVLRSILDYAPDIGLSEPNKSMLAGWWMATWIRDDRLVALGRIDVSKNQFVRYPDPKNVSIDNPNAENPLGGIFSDLPAISILDINALRVQDREIRDWIKPNMRLIHYIFGKLTQLGPGQYILGHKKHDINANIYCAIQKTDQSTKTKNSKGSSSVTGHYDLHAAHISTPQIVKENVVEGTGGGGGNAGVGAADDDLTLQWIGTPDQIPGTFPYDEHEHERSAKPPRNQRGNRGKKSKRSRASK
ncbi:hypothetical protein BGZ76_002152 [Entomortierella beljakovae]|nr:hypothetical protein BGZ76_002152 [Entomortierella beljakovae]